MSPFALPYRRVQPALGTWLELTVANESGDAAHRLMTRAFAEAHRLEGVFSRFDSDSEMSRLNRLPQGVVALVSGEMLGVLSLGRDLEARSHRAFRLMPECFHRAPCYELGAGSVLRHESCFFDLGGIAKGYIVDRVFAFLEEQGARGAFSVNAGGDFRSALSEEVEIRVPAEVAERRYALRVGPGAVATSSTEGRWLGVGVPTAHYPGPPGRAHSAAAVASRCAVADAFTKVALFGDVTADLLSEFGVRAVYAFDERGGLLERDREAS